jgi:hypothetical protein
MTILARKEARKAKYTGGGGAKAECKMQNVKWRMQNGERARHYGLAAFCLAILHFAFFILHFAFPGLLPRNDPFPGFNR